MSKDGMPKVTPDLSRAATTTQILQGMQAEARPVRDALNALNAALDAWGAEDSVVLRLSLRDHEVIAAYLTPKQAVEDGPEIRFTGEVIQHQISGEER